MLPGVGLAMRRLAIVDLAGGQQPFANEDGSLQLVANSEIYNFRKSSASSSLVDTSSARNPTSRCWFTLTRSTGRASCDESAACLPWRSGTTAPTLLAARDRAGEKPLYYTLTRDGLRLASEIKALLARARGGTSAGRRSARSVSHLRIRDRAADDFPGHPQAAGRALSLYRDGEVRIERYWDAADVQIRQWRIRRRPKRCAGLDSARCAAR